MKKLIVLVSLFGLVGCQDAQMNLGPEEATATGGSAGGTNVTVGAAAGQATGGAGGMVTPVGGAGGVGATAGTAFAGGTAGEGGEGGEGGIAGEGGEGGIAGEGGEGGGTTFHGIDLEGLQRFTVTVTGGMPAKPGGPCWGDEPKTYELDLTTGALTFEHCAVAADGTTVTRAQESRILTDAELTSAMMYLKLISTDYRLSCGFDAPIKTLDLSFADHTAKYQDDFYSNCSGASNRGVTFVSNLGYLGEFLQSSNKISAIPNEYDTLTLYILPPKTFDTEWMYTACQTNYSETYIVDFAASTVKLTSCGSILMENRVGPSEKSRTLTASEVASLRASVAALKLGATADCSHELGVPILQLEKSGTYVAAVAGEHAACPWSGAWSSTPVLNLDAVHTVLMYLINPPV